MNSEAEDPVSAALMQRDAVMMLLIAQSQGLIQQLALLAGSEKAAIAGLLAVGQAMTVYARAAQPDAEVMASFDRVMAALSPALAGRLTRLCPLQICLKESSAYAGLLAACLRTGRERRQCERDALAEAAAETACMTRSLKELLAVIAPSADVSQRKTGAARSIPSHR